MLAQLPLRGRVALSLHTLDGMPVAGGEMRPEFRAQLLEFLDEGSAGGPDGRSGVVAERRRRVRGRPRARPLAPSTDVEGPTFVVDISTGVERWRIEPGESAIGQTDDVVVVSATRALSALTGSSSGRSLQSSTGTLQAVDATSGDKLWAVEGRSSYGDLLAMGDGVVVLVVAESGEGLVGPDSLSKSCEIGVIVLTPSTLKRHVERAHRIC